METDSQSKRRRWTATRKLDVVLEGLREGKAPVHIAEKYHIRPGQYIEWRERALAGALLGLKAEEDDPRKVLMNDLKEKAIAAITKDIVAARRFREECQPTLEQWNNSLPPDQAPFLSIDDVVERMFRKTALNYLDFAMGLGIISLDDSSTIKQLSQEIFRL